jgi:Arc/MetJ-type ribon-helix-helix transcriptional regulator
MCVTSLGMPYGNVCDIVRINLRKYVISLDRPYGNMCEIIRNALRKCV